LKKRINIKNFPIKPTRGGIPARDKNKKMIVNKKKLEEFSIFKSIRFINLLVLKKKKMANIFPNKTK